MNIAVEEHPQVFNRVRTDLTKLKGVILEDHVFPTRVYNFNAINIYLMFSRHGYEECRLLGCDAVFLL
jgi:uncharacterized protein YozE (UPF0346 family)